MTTSIFEERTAAYTYLPEAGVVIAALRRLGQRVEFAWLDTIKPELPHKLALATACPDAPAVAALQVALAAAFQDSQAGLALVSWAVMKRVDAGYIVAFPALVAAPVRVLG